MRIALSVALLFCSSTAAIASPNGDKAYDECVASLPYDYPGKYSKCGYVRLAVQKKEDDIFWAQYGGRPNVQPDYEMKAYEIEQDYKRDVEAINRDYNLRRSRVIAR